MSLELLDKTRKMNMLISGQKSEDVDFTVFCNELSELMGVNVLLLSKKGKVLGISVRKNIPVIDNFKGLKKGSFIVEELRERFESVLSTRENVNLTTFGLKTSDGQKCNAMVSPIMISGKRLGTVFVYNFSAPFDIDDIILLEYSIVVIGLSMQKSITREDFVESRKTDDLSGALSTLTSRELSALEAILKKLGGKKSGIIVTSKLAGELEITRSVMLNALKKCQSAGVISTHSAGMRGTSILVTNDLLNLKTVEHFIGEEK